jgi:hypothetical protein
LNVRFAGWLSVVTVDQLPSASRDHDCERLAVAIVSS